MEADAVSQVFALGVWRLAKHPHDGEAVSDASSQVKSKREDQVTTPRAKAGAKPEHRQGDGRSGGHDQILAAGEAMAYGCRVHRRHGPAHERDAETRSCAKVEHHQPVNRFMRDHQQCRDSQDQQDVDEPNPNRPAGPTSQKHRRQGEHWETNHHDGYPNRAPDEGLRATRSPVDDIWNLLPALTRDHILAADILSGSAPISLGTR
jgi:hypothetical protein